MKIITVKNGIYFFGKRKDILEALASLAKDYKTVSELIHSKLH